MATANEYVNVAAGTGAVNHPLELKRAPEAMVRLWLKHNEVDPEAHLSLLDKLLEYQGGGSSRKTSAYRFVGACLDRKAGVDYVCMSFCLERERPRTATASSGARLSVD